MNAGFRRLIQRQLSADPQLGGMLASFNGEPCIFYQKAPHDSRPGWGDVRYPRMDFNVDVCQDPERKTAGTMTFNIWCSTECPEIGNQDPDRAIETRLTELIDGTFYTGDGTTVCAEWERSDEFATATNLQTSQSSSLPEVYGLTVVFELMEFPRQITTNPDPIQGLNQWTKHHFREMVVIAWDDMPPVWKPTDPHPAIYWRFAGTESTNRQSYAVTWFTGTFAAHIIAESTTERNKWIKAIAERAQVDGEVILPDTSPMFIQRLAIQHGADALRDGQFLLTGRYGVLTQPVKEPTPIKLNHPYYSYAKDKEESIMAQATATYRVAELAAQAWKVFGTTPEAVTVALREAGLASATLEEAKEAVQAFLNREVK